MKFMQMRKHFIIANVSIEIFCLISVCKEWLVREDNALAHHLQTQEIHEHYKGNRFRNQVVREDFPTALHEQRKEEETAEKQAAMYYQMINEQEQADARIAKQLADRLRTDTEREQQRQILYSEQLARRLQDELIIGNQHNHHHQPQQQQHQQSQHFPPPIPRSELPAKKQAIPSPSGKSQRHQVDDLSRLRSSSAQQHLNYVSLDLENGQRIHRANPSTQYTEIIPQQNKVPAYNLQAHTPEKKQPPPPPPPLTVTTLYQNDGRADDKSLASPELGACGQMSPGYTEVYTNFVAKSTTSPIHSNQSSIDLPYNLPVNSNINRQQYIDNQPNSIGLNLDYRPATSNNHNGHNGSKSIASNSNDIESISRYVDGNSSNRQQHRVVEKLSPEKFDYLMGNKLESLHLDRYDESGMAVSPPLLLVAGAIGGCEGSPMYVNSGVQHHKFPPSSLSPKSSANWQQPSKRMVSDEFSPNDRIKTMQELGVPPDEILEIDRRITQEERDEVCVWLSFFFF